jgi:hypothetical protein
MTASRLRQALDINRLAVLCVGLALLAPVPAASAARSTGPRAQRSGIHLTLPEARREVRYRIKRLARMHGDTALDYEVGGCVRYSARRVRCRMYETYKAGSDGETYICTGQVEVIEFVNRYRTRPKSLRCV